MSLLAALRAFLIQRTAITDIIVSGDAARIGPAGAHAEHPGVPAIRYQRVGAGREPHLRGPGGIVERHVEINCWADTLDDAEALAKQVRLALDGHPKGDFGAGEHIINCRGITLEDEGDNDEPPIDASLVGKQRTTMTFSIWHTETT